MLLRSTESGEANLMRVIDALSDVYKVVVTLIVQSLSIAVTLRLRSEKSESPTLLAHAG